MREVLESYYSSPVQSTMRAVTGDPWGFFGCPEGSWGCPGKGWGGLREVPGVLGVPWNSFFFSYRRVNLSMV